MTKPILEVKDLDVFFGTGDAQVAAVKGATFSINPAETVALVGESGSGKSVSACQSYSCFRTLVRHILLEVA